jgi:deoxyribodipyrimidine photolyase-related protein
MKTANIIFPHQLFKESPLFKEKGDYYLIEEPLYFKYFKFHVQKLILHRSSMKYYFDFLLKKNKIAQYLNFDCNIADVRELIPHLKKNDYLQINYIDTNDNYLERRIFNAGRSSKIKLNRIESPMFLNSSEELEVFFDSKKKKIFSNIILYTAKKKIRNSPGLFRRANRGEMEL